MKRLKLLVAGFAFVASLVVVLGITSGTALAEERTWTGGGGNNNLATAENWAGDVAPGNGDSIVLPVPVLASGCSGLTDITLNNDLNFASVTLAGISVTGTRPAGCYGSTTIGGNAIKTSGDITSEVVLLTIDAPITLAGSMDFQRVHSLSSLTIAAYNVTLGNTYFDGGVSGSGQVTIGGIQVGGAGGGCNGGSILPYPFRGDSSSFSGAIVIINYGYLTISPNSTDAARHASSITLQSGGYLSLITNYGENLDFDGQITVNGGTISAFQHDAVGCPEKTSPTTATFSGTMNITQTVEANYYWANLVFGGNVSGGEHITVLSGLSASGSVTLPGGAVVTSPLRTRVIDDSNKSSYCSSFVGLSAYIDRNNRYIVNVTCEGTNPSQLTVAGILSGIGTINNPVKVVSGGVIAPGESPGILTVGNLLFEEGGTYDFEIGGAEPGQYDQIKVIGTVTLGNGTLNTSFWDGFRPKGGEQFIIIDNDGSDPVDGTFKDLPEGATFSIDGVVFRINYAGGDGNDVVLTVISVPAAPDTGVGLFKNNPILTFATTSVLAGGIYLIARKQKLLLKK